MEFFCDLTYSIYKKANHNLYKFFSTIKNTKNIILNNTTIKNNHLFDYLIFLSLTITYNNVKIF